MCVKFERMSWFCCPIVGRIIMGYRVVEHMKRRRGWGTWGEGGLVVGCLLFVLFPAHFFIRDLLWMIQTHVLIIYLYNISAVWKWGRAAAAPDIYYVWWWCHLANCKVHSRNMHIPEFVHFLVLVPVPVPISVALPLVVLQPPVRLRPPNYSLERSI